MGCKAHSILTKKETISVAHIVIDCDRLFNYAYGVTKFV